MTGDERAFLEAVIAAPADDLPRLVFADYLDERGDPRGEFVRVQCALESLPADHPDRPMLLTRERELLWEHEQHWLAPLDEFVSQATFRRGFLDEVVVMTEAFLREGSAIFAAHPVRKIKFRGAQGYGPALAKVADLARLEAVDLGYVELTPDDLAALAMAPPLAALRELSLAGNTLGDAGMVRVAGGVWHRLESLNLDITRITGAGVRTLVDSSRFDGLRFLALAENALYDEGVRALATAPFLRQLPHLDLTATHAGDVGVMALAASPGLAGVHDLRLSYNRLSAGAAEALARSPHARGLRRLDLNANSIGDAGVRALLASPLARSLELLSVSLNSLSDETLRLLEESMAGRWG